MVVVLLHTPFVLQYLGVTLVSLYVLLFSSSFCPEQLVSPAQPFSCFYLIIGQIYLLQSTLDSDPACNCL